MFVFTKRTYITTISITVIVRSWGKRSINFAMNGAPYISDKAKVVSRAEQIIILVKTAIRTLVNDAFLCRHSPYITPPKMPDRHISGFGAP